MYLFAAIFIFIIGAGAIIAYNPSGTGNPSVLGHSANEVSGTVVGACSVMSNAGQSAGNFYWCAYIWGAGKCQGSYGSVSCSCTSGTLVATGAGYAWVSTGVPNGAEENYLCITP